MSATVQSRHSGSDSPSMWQSPNQPADRRATLRRCSMLLLPSPRARGTRFDQFADSHPSSRDFGTPDPSSKASFTKLRQDSTKRATSAGVPPRFWGSAGVEPGNHGTSGGSTRRAASSRRHLLGHEDVVTSRFDGGGPLPRTASSATRPSPSPVLPAEGDAPSRGDQNSRPYGRSTMCRRPRLEVLWVDILCSGPIATALP